MRSTSLALSAFVACLLTAVGCDKACEPPRSDPGQPAADLNKAIKLRGGVLAKFEDARQLILRGFGFTEGGPCLAPPPVTAADIDENRSLFVHDRATLDAANVSLEQTLGQLATQAVSGGATGTTAQSIFRELWETQISSTTFAASTAGAHCDDGGGTLNGFPVTCRPAEGAQATNPAVQMNRYHAIALVNRLDLAGEGWRNCGEHRIVYGRTDSQTFSRNFIIFEAVLPNPTPGCRSGCRPVADFWRSLSIITDPNQRGAMLHDFFYQGLPGFRPVVHIDHYTARGVESGYGGSGSGQIRTNQFMQQPWSLREFRLALDCGSAPCKLAVVPTMVKVNPFGALFSQENTDARAAAFQADVINSVAGLAASDINSFGYGVDLDHDAAESNAGGALPDHYLTAFNPLGAMTTGGFRQMLGTAALAKGLQSRQVVNRALALSCAGCHAPQQFGLATSGAIGAATLPDGTTTTTWPLSLDFVHTSERATNGMHALSPALTNVFLPARKAFLVDLLSEDICPCKRTFVRVPDLRRPVAVGIQEEVIKTFSPRINPLVNELREAPPAAAPALRARLAELEQARDAQMVTELRRAGIEVEPLALDLAPRPDRFEAVKQAGGDARKEGELRRQAVMRQIKAEPPRRTVTGHFRVH